ncbi:MAG: J domain-containing protein [Holosporales bacterium]
MQELERIRYHAATDYYGVLGVDRNADDAAIKKAYRALARSYHPDVYTDDTIMPIITEAWGVLGDTDRKKEYDGYLPQLDRLFTQRAAWGEDVWKNFASLKLEQKINISQDYDIDLIAARIPPTTDIQEYLKNFLDQMDAKAHARCQHAASEAPEDLPAASAEAAYWQQVRRASFAKDSDILPRLQERIQRGASFDIIKGDMVINLGIYRQDADTNAPHVIKIADAYKSNPNTMHAASATDIPATAIPLTIPNHAEQLLETVKKPWVWGTAAAAAGAALLVSFIKRNPMDPLSDFTDKVKDFPHKVLNTGIKWGDTTTSTNPWEELKYRLGNGGDANPAQQSAVRAIFKEIARGYNAQRPGLNLNADEMLAAYRKGREAAAADVPSRINGAFSELEKHISLKEANSAVPHANPIAHLGEHIKQTFNNLINPDVRIASSNAGVVSDMGNGILPPQGVLSGLGQHLQHFAKTTQEAVGATARHASNAVGHAWNSEPVQGALHSSATYTVVSLAATAASVRLQAVLEDRKAAAAKAAPEPPKNLGERFQRMATTAREVTGAFFTKGDISLQSHLDQFKKAPVQMGLLRAALIPVCAQAAIAATVIGFSSLAARGVHAATKDRKGFEQLAAASLNVAEMKYLTDATAYAAATTKNLGVKASKALTEQKQNFAKTYPETTKNIQQTMRNVQDTMAGLWHGMTNRFKMA